MLNQSGSHRAGRKEWVGLATLSLACILYVMDLTILHLAVPQISRDLRPDSTQLLWIIDIYGFMVAGSLITMGTLGDRIGRRRLLMIGAASFGVASVFAAFSTSAEMLIATRALLGLAGATLAPSTLSLIRSMFHDPRQRTRAISIWITSFSLGGAIGPLLGGLILEFFWWGAAFLVAVPVMALLLFLGPKLLPEYKDPNAGRTDVISAVLSLLAVLSMIFALKQVAQNGFGRTAAVSAVVGIAIGVVFVRRQRRLVHPFIDLRLFRVPGFAASLVTYGMGVVLVFGGFLFLPQYLQLVLGLSPMEAGLWTLPWALAFVVGSQLTPRISRSVRPAYLMAGGLVLAAVGFAVLAQLSTTPSFLTVVVGSVAFSLGTSPLFTLTNDLIIGRAPAERAGAAAGLAETSAEFGGAIGIAVFGSIGVALYRDGVNDKIPSDVAAPAAEIARNTLGGAIEVAATLPARVGTALVDAGREAFLTGLHVAAIVSTVGVIALAIFVALALRNAELTSEDDEEPSDDDDPILEVCGVGD